MKKNSNFLILAFVLAIFSFGSCKDIKPKDVSLKNMNDSINYTLGHWQGDVFKQQYFGEDADGQKLEAFIKSLDKAYGNKNGDEMYDLGVQVGKYFNDQSKNGYFGDSTLVGDIDMVMIGLVNALNDYQDVVSSSEADSIVQAVQMKVHSKMYGAPNN
ncbi:MAG: hypothetical protein PHQ11_06310 [Paludibacter sp.]|nr:hypothetical protein [Paludibacter sp.]MDD4199436.1 hypothetical protein [Paludibacter sp.]MDD4427281.1 hypothetical protein [Paludibacter sp.]